MRNNSFSWYSNFGLISKLTRQYYISRYTICVAVKTVSWWKELIFIEDLREAIDEALSLLGEAAKQAVYCHLNRKYGLTQQEIPYRIEEFSEALESLFGTAAQLLQTLIMKELYKKIKKSIRILGNSTNLDFNSYIESTRVANLCVWKGSNIIFDIYLVYPKNWRPKTSNIWRNVVGVPQKLGGTSTIKPLSTVWRNPRNLDYVTFF